MAQVVSLSRPGYNWYDTDHSHLIFHSSDNCAKVFAKGAVTAPSLAGFGFHSFTVAHNLGFTPHAEAMQKHPITGAFSPVTVEADATNIYFQVRNPTGTVASISGYYKIGYEGSS